jgi:hypothetical protein
MSIVRAPRGKARNLYKPWASLDQGYARPPERPAKLRTPQDCYVCLQVMAIGTMASWSSGDGSTPGAPSDGRATASGPDLLVPGGCSIGQVGLERRCCSLLQSVARSTEPALMAWRMLAMAC